MLGANCTFSKAQVAPATASEAIFQTEQKCIAWDLEQACNMSAHFPCGLHSWLRLSCCSYIVLACDVVMQVWLNTEMHIAR